MSCSQAFKIFRQCTASLPPRVSHQRAVLNSRLSSLSPLARSYSTPSDSNTASSSDGKDEGSSENASAAKDAQASSSGESQLAPKLKAKEDEVVDLTSRLRYLQADFLNLQRNAAREKEQTKDFAITRFAGDLLETADVLSLALKSIPQEVVASFSTSPSQPGEQSTSSESSSPSQPSSSTTQKSAHTHLAELYTGVEMTHRLLLQTLFKYNVKPFDPTGDKFDPNRHEALYQAPIPGKEPGTIIDTQKIGYTIKDRTLRAAQVGVVAEQS